jgi:hypothetical protein
MHRYPILDVHDSQVAKRRRIVDRQDLEATGDRLRKAKHWARLERHSNGARVLPLLSVQGQLERHEIQAAIVALGPYWPIYQSCQAWYTAVALTL